MLQVVAWIRRLLRVEKTGHSGTLDPKVTGERLHTRLPKHCSGGTSGAVPLAAHDFYRMWTLVDRSTQKKCAHQQLLARKHVYMQAT